MTTALYQKTLTELQASNPDIEMSSVTYKVPQDFFDAQKEVETEGELKGFVSVIVLSQDERIVLARRPEGTPGWALPGGGVGIDESFEEAAEREILAGLGLRLEDLTLLMIEEETFVSPSGETTQSLLALFAGLMKKFALPPATPEAKEEGLELALFELDQLPEQMVLTDREKIGMFLVEDDSVA